MKNENLDFQSMNLNIRYDAPQEVWNKVPQIYEKLEGWLGYNSNLPYWFGFDEDKKHICASLDPSGFQFFGLVEEEAWEKWKHDIKKVATTILGYKVGEIEEGEVDY